LHTAFEPGDVLKARGREWVLLSATQHADCCELNLEPAGGRDGPALAEPAVLLAPFDRPSVQGKPGSVHVVSRRAWMATLRLAVLAQREPSGLAAAARAGVDLLPHQLGPAMAVVRDGARRLLLADAVGLGKTIEAGFVVAELQARSVLDRVLVLAPPGLCDQWCAELSGRFGMDAVVADAAWLRRLRAALPAAVNPWAVPGLRIASLDFAKRPEVRRSIEHVWWDVLVVDEAHLAAGDSERRAAAHAFACRARFVLLLTATPHSGDPRTFEALCGIGALSADDPIVMFRRSRVDAGLLRSRRVHLQPVRGSAAEIATRRQLDSYISRVWRRRAGPEGRDARLAMVVLAKRSFSGMEPLRRSLLTRLDRLGEAPPSTSAQLALAWDDETDSADAAPSGILGAAGLDDPSEERQVLCALAHLATIAGARDSKRRVLLRLLGRLREPAIVFTEYRDTLEGLRQALGPDTAVLHGGMDRSERAETIRRFNGGGARVLLATDAAGEGLNLQHRCRLVINLELPWNPMRLEQRIGRVDRIGQPATVHAINLLASGTAESRLLARLASRLGRARDAVGAIDDVLGGSEEAVLAGHLGLDARPAGLSGRAATAIRLASADLVQCLSVEGSARALAASLELRRQLLRVSGTRAPRSGARVAGRRRGVQVASVRRGRLPAPLGRTGVLVVLRIRSAAPAGFAPFDELVPVFIEGPCERISTRRGLRAIASDFIARRLPLLAAAVPPRPAAPGPRGGPFDRDACLTAQARGRRAVQRGLFDSRAEREAGEAEERAGRREAQPGVPHAPAIDADGESRRFDPQPELLLFVTS